MDGLAFVIIVLIIGWFIYDYSRDLTTPAQKKKISENKKVAEQKLAKQTELAESRLNDLIQQHVKTLAVKLQQLTSVCQKTPVLKNGCLNFKQSPA